MQNVSVLLFSLLLLNINNIFFQLMLFLSLIKKETAFYFVRATFWT